MPIALVRWLFGLSALFGLAVLPPLYVLRPDPPALTHDQFYYGFIASAIGFQIVYLLIAADPRRYRPLMPLGALSKLGFAIPCLLAWRRGDAGAETLAAAAIDGALALAFLAAWAATGVGKRVRSPT